MSEVNKVEYGNTILIDLTSDTANASNVLAGVTGHSADGSSFTGTLITHDVIDNLTSTSADDALSANQGRVLKELNDRIMGDDGLLIAKTSITATGTEKDYSDYFNFYGIKISDTLPDNYNDLGTITLTPEGGDAVTLDNYFELREGGGIYFNNTKPTDFALLFYDNSAGFMVTVFGAIPNGLLQQTSGVYVIKASYIVGSQEDFYAPKFTKASSYTVTFGKPWVTTESKKSELLKISNGNGIYSCDIYIKGRNGRRDWYSYQYIDSITCSDTWGSWYEGSVGPFSMYKSPFVFTNTPYREVKVLRADGYLIPETGGEGATDHTNLLFFNRPTSATVTNVYLLIHMWELAPWESATG